MKVKTKTLERAASSTDRRKKRVVDHARKLETKVNSSFPALTGTRRLYGRHGGLAASVKVNGPSSRAWHALFPEVLNFKVTFHDRDENRSRKKAYDRAVKTIQYYQVVYFQFGYRINVDY